MLANATNELAPPALPYLQALSSTYPTAHSAICEAAGLAAKLDLPMGLVHVISDILGHSSSTSTMIYAKADVGSLRTADQDFEEE